MPPSVTVLMISKTKNNLVVHIACYIYYQVGFIFLLELNYIFKRFMNLIMMSAVGIHLQETMISCSFICQKVNIINGIHKIFCFWH